MRSSPLALCALTLTIGALSGCAASRPTTPTDYAAPMDDGLRVVYTDAGPRDPDTPPLVFIHGWASDRTTWRRQLDALHDDYRVITIDLPGHGQSDAPEDVEYTFDVLADGVRAVLNDAGVEEAILVGHSNGVPVSRHFYRKYPWRVEGIVAVDGAFINVFPEQMAPMIRSQLVSDTYQSFMMQMASGMLGTLPEEDAEEIKAMMLATPQHVVVGVFDAMNGDEVWARDPIEVPVLAVYVAGFPMWSDEYWRETRAFVPQLELSPMEGVSHFLMINEPAEFNRRLEAWVDRGGDVVR